MIKRGKHERPMWHWRVRALRRSMLKERTGVGWVCRGLAVFCALLVVVSVWQCISYLLENRRSERLRERLLEMAVTMHETEQELAPITVDFDALHEENPDIIAWVYCPDTVISYPVVQSTDNKYYLRRGVDGSRRVAGCIFADFRNAPDFSDENVIIYGHNMTDDTMFGLLPEYAAQEFYEEHPTWYLLTPETDYKVELFAGFVTSTSSPIYSTEHKTTEDGYPIMDKAWSDSNFHGGPPPAEGERTVTLSTCSYEFSGARYVLIGTLHKLDRA